MKQVKRQIVAVCCLGDVSAIYCYDICNCKVGDSVLVERNDTKCEAKVQSIIQETNRVIKYNILCKIESRYTILKKQERDCIDAIKFNKCNLYTIISDVDHVKVAKALSLYPDISQDLRNNIKNSLKAFEDCEKKKVEIQTLLGENVDE